MNLIDKILERSLLCVGTNPMGWDRLFVNGNKEKAHFFALLSREWKEKNEALDLAAFTMQKMDEELQALRESVKASGLVSMDIGEPRKPSKDQQ